MTKRAAVDPLPDPISRLLAVFALLRILVRVITAEVREAKAALAPLLPGEEESDRRCLEDKLTLPMRLDRDSDLLLARLAPLHALAEAVLQGAASGRDQAEEDHDAVLARLAAAMADSASPAGGTLRRLRETLEVNDGPGAQAKLKSERIQSPGGSGKGKDT